MKTNTFDEEKWKLKELKWKQMLFWSVANEQKPIWAIVPDTPGNKEQTVQKWHKYAGDVKQNGIKTALAVQDGMSVEDAELLNPDVIAIGGTTEWKWKTIEMWAESFPHVHVLRCNAPDKLDYLKQLGIKSCDGTGWNRGDRKQTAGLERFLRKSPKPITSDLNPFVCRAPKDSKQTSFA